MKNIAAFAMLLAAGAAGAAEPATGKQVFDRFCAECHAPGFGHPGTMMLEQTRGKALSVLQARKDLIPVYVTTVVRNGLAEMPPYRPTEIDAAALDALVAYLAPAKVAAKTR